MWRICQSVPHWDCEECQRYAGNHAFRVAALAERSRIHGILRWSGGEYCLLDYVPARSDVQVGDVIVTSGHGGIYPRGLRLGVVVEIAEDVTSILKTVFVKPSVDFSRVEEVAVLTHDGDLH